MKTNFMNDISIKYKLIFSTVVGIIVPIFALFYVLLNQLYMSYIDREFILLEDSMSRIESDMEGVFDDAFYLSATFLADHSLNWKLRNQTSLSTYDQIRILTEVQDSINAHIYGNDAVDDIFIYHSNPDLNLELNVKPYNVEDMPEDIQAFLQGEDSFYIRIQDRSITFFRVLNPLLTANTNYMEMHLTDQAFVEALQDNWITNKGGQVYLACPDGKILYSNIGAYGNLEEVPPTIEDLIADNTAWVTQGLFSYGDYLEDLQLVVVMDQPAFLATQFNEIRQLFLILIIILGFVTLTAGVVGRNISGRLVILKEAMERSEEGLLHPLESDIGKDEIGVTGKTYNYMIDEIKKLIDEKSEANLELQKANRALEDSNREVIKQNVRINRLIYEDELTGLQNKFSINKAIKTTIETNQKETVAAVAFLDIDNFKNINDTYGHDMGDQLINKTGERLKSFVNDTFEIGRFGGDEFLLLIHLKEAEESLDTIINAIQQAFEKPFVVDKRRFYLTVSIGISIFPDHGTSKSELLQKADLALYEAKGTGRNKHVVYESRMGDVVDEKNSIQEKIIDAFKAKEFYLVYQPYVNVATREVEGYEALIRWQSPTLGFVSPFKLITISEEMGFIIELGEWILREACLFAKEINESSLSPIQISINVSGVQFMDPGFYSKLMTIIDEVGVAKEHICLEMTETIFINSLEQGTKLFEKLREEGIKIALDDFGTGYSSLKYFNDLPLDYLKIDKTFIDELLEGNTESGIVDVMMQIAHKREVKVTAEGVEVEGQYDYLKKMGCDRIQGYYFSKPLSREIAMKGVLI